MERLFPPYEFDARGSDVPAPALGRPATGSMRVAKSPRDYIRALRRRGALAACVAVLVSTLGILWTVRQPAYYSGQVELKIVPSQFDLNLSVIVETPANLNRDNNEQFVLDTISRLRSKSVVDAVIREFEPVDVAAGAALAEEIETSIVMKRTPGTNTFLVSFESRDQSRVAKVLNALVRAFAQEVQDEGKNKLETSAQQADALLTRFRSELNVVNGEINRMVQANPIFAPDGSSLVLREYLDVKEQLLHKRAQLGELEFERAVADIWPGLKTRALLDEKSAAKFEELSEARSRLVMEHAYRARVTRNPRGDAYLKQVRAQIDRIDHGLAQLRTDPAPQAPPDRASMQVRRIQDEIHQIERELAGQEQRMRDTAPTYQEYLAKTEQRDELVDLINKTQDTS